jgi:hypothetical protein
MDRLVSHPDGERIAIGVGVHGDGSDAHPLCCLYDPAGNLAPVGDKNFSEHGSETKHACRIPQRVNRWAVNGNQRPSMAPVEDYPAAAGRTLIFGLNAGAGPTISRLANRLAETRAARYVLAVMRVIGQIK